MLFFFDDNISKKYSEAEYKINKIKIKRKLSQDIIKPDNARINKNNEYVFNFNFCDFGFIRFPNIVIQIEKKNRIILKNAVKEFETNTRFKA